MEFLAFVSIIIIWLAGVVICLGIYMIPSIIAFYRKHERCWLILALNLVLGATLLGWIAALIWACLNPNQEAKIASEVKSQAESLTKSGE